MFDRRRRGRNPGTSTLKRKKNRRPASRRRLKSFLCRVPVTLRFRELRYIVLSFRWLFVAKPWWYFHLNRSHLFHLRPPSCWTLRSPSTSRRPAIPLLHCLSCLVQAPQSF